MENKQHTQVPNNMAKDNLEPKDQLIYAILHSHLNSETKACFPSLQTLSKESGASINTVRASITRLKEAGYIKTEIRGRQTYYTFDEYKKFEPFSKDFISNKDISFTTKSYLIASQQYMYKDIEGVGKMALPNTQLGLLINMPESTVRRCNKELESKNYLQLVKNEARDIATGLKTETKIFELNKLGQAVIWTLGNHEDRITQNTEDIDLIKERLAKMEKSNEEKDKLIKALLDKLNEKSDTPIEYNF